MIRYRSSHAFRSKIINERRQFRLRFLYYSLVIFAFILMVLAVWILMYESQAKFLVNWLLDRPVPISSLDSTQTAAWKTHQQTYHKLDLALYGALINLQVSPARIKETMPRRLIKEGKYTPLGQRVSISPGYSLAECNLEISRAIVGVGGNIARAEERSRSGELIFEIAYGGTITNNLHIKIDPKLKKKTARLAVVIAYSDQESQIVAEELVKFEQPLTFALLPWASGARDLAENIETSQHELLLLLPVKPKVFTRAAPRRRSVIFNHNQTVNRRIIRNALSSLPRARGILGFPGNLENTERDILDPIIDEITKHKKYYLDGPGRIYLPNKVDHINEQLQTWGVIDTIDNPAIISKKLDLASLSALDHKQAIVVAKAKGHTLNVLANDMKRLQLRGIKFVTVSDLLEDYK